MITTFIFRTAWRRGPVVDDVLIAFVASDTLDVDSFATLLESELDKNLVPDEMILVARGSAASAIIDLFKTDTGIDALKSRFGKKAKATLATFSAGKNEPKRIRLWGSGAPCELPLEAIRRRGATRLFTERRGFVESTPNYHFQNPSGRHTERFVRLSNILTRPSEISFLAFCLLPQIPTGARYCYVDTVAMLPLVAALNDHWRALDPDRAPLSADSFASYDGLERYAFTRQSESFVLISASSSGGLARRVVEAEPRFDSGSIVHVLFHGSDPAPYLAAINLGYDADHNPEGTLHKTSQHVAENCLLCQDGSTVIPFHGEQFDFAGPQHEPVLVVKTDAPRGLNETMGRYVGSGVFAVGRQGTTTPGPRLYLIAPDKLLAAAAFQERVTYAAKRLVPAGLHKVVLLDADSRAFAEQIIKSCGGALQVEYVPASDLSSLAGLDEPILIAAAVIESGRSLQDISHDLRNLCPNAPQVYLVGAAKTTGLGRLDSIRNTLVQTDKAIKHEFAVLETLVAPASDKRNAWQRELDFLSDPSIGVATGDVAKRISDRRELLESASPLSDNVFIDNAADLHIAIQPGFVFWPAKATDTGLQADVFYTVSSILQNLRSETAKPPQAIRSNWFQQTLLAPENFARFNDSAVQASFLRAARPEEMNYSSQPTRSREVARILRRVLEAASKPRGGAAAEILMAIATKRMRLHPTDRKDLVAPLESDAPPLVEFLASWCRENESNLA